MPSESWDQLNLLCITKYFDFLWYTIKFRCIALKDDKFNDVLSEKVSLFALEYWYKLDFDFFLVDQVHTGLNFFQHLLDHKSKLIHLFAGEDNTCNFTWLIIDTNEDSATFGIEEGDNGFEQNMFQEGLSDGKGVVFELNGHTFEWKSLIEEKVAFASETGTLEGNRLQIHGQYKII